MSVVSFVLSDLRLGAISVSNRRITIGLCLNCQVNPILMPFLGKRPIFYLSRLNSSDEVWRSVNQSCLCNTSLRGFQTAKADRRYLFRILAAGFHKASRGIHTQDESHSCQVLDAPTSRIGYPHHFWICQLIMPRLSSHGSFSALRLLCKMSPIELPHGSRRVKRNSTDSIFHSVRRPMKNYPTRSPLRKTSRNHLHDTLDPSRRFI